MIKFGSSGEYEIRDSNKAKDIKIKKIPIISIILLTRKSDVFSSILFIFDYKIIFYL